jgi:HEAT repeat protein
MQGKFIALLALGVLATVSGCCKDTEIPRAVRGLYSQEARERNSSLQVLAQCSAKAESSVPRIAALMYDKNVGVASSAAYALRKIDSRQAREALKRAEDSRGNRRGS